jgi:hypothetical protein
MIQPPSSLFMFDREQGPGPGAAGRRGRIAARPRSTGPRPRRRGRRAATWRRRPAPPPAACRIAGQAGLLSGPDSPGRCGPADRKPGGRPARAPEDAPGYPAGGPEPGTVGLPRLPVSDGMMVRHCRRRRVQHCRHFATGTVGAHAYHPGSTPKGGATRRARPPPCRGVRAQRPETTIALTARLGYAIMIAL